MQELCSLLYRTYKIGISSWGHEKENIKKIYSVHDKLDIPAIIYELFINVYNLLQGMISISDTKKYIKWNN